MKLWTRGKAASRPKGIVVTLTSKDIAISLSRSKLSGLTASPLIFAEGIKHRKWVKAF